MNKQQAIDSAQVEANRYGVTLVVYKDNLSEYPESPYEYLPESCVDLLPNKYTAGLLRDYNIVQVCKPK